MEIIASFLRAFAKLRKMTTSFVMSVRPSVRLSISMKQLDSHWTDFDDILYLDFFRKCIEKIQAVLKSDKCNVYFT
jgi:hypothetical protein